MIRTFGVVLWFSYSLLRSDGSGTRSAGRLYISRRYIIFMWGCIYILVLYTLKKSIDQRSLFLLSVLDQIFALNKVLSTRTPSSSCSATVNDGNFAGMILRGWVPGMSEYLSKFVTPVFRRKSSSSSRQPFTVLAGAFSMASIASEKIVWSEPISQPQRSYLPWITYWFPKIFHGSWIRGSC